MQNQSLPQSKLTKKPLISISVISHHQTDLVIDMLRSLEKHSENTDFEILLTENLPPLHALSSDEFPALNLHSILNAKPMGFAANHNQASKVAKGAYFCLLNPDVVFIENIFPQLIADIEKDWGDIAAPLVINSNGDIQDSFRDLPSPRDILRRRVKTWQPPALPLKDDRIYPDWIAGICLIMKHETYQSLGGLDEKFFLYFEDVDFGCRARLMGKRLFVDTRCRITHDARRSSHRTPRYFIQHLTAASRFFTSDVYRKVKALTSK